MPGPMGRARKLFLLALGRLDRRRAVGRHRCRFGRGRRRHGLRDRARLDNHRFVPSTTSAHRPRPALAAPMILAAVSARARLATRPRPWSARCLAAWPRCLGARPIATGARAIPEPRTISGCWTISERRAISESRAISERRTISAGRTATRRPLASRPVAGRARSAAIEARTPLWSCRLLPPRRIDGPPIAATSLVRGAGQHPPFPSLSQIAPRQIGVAGESIEPATAASKTAGTTAAAGAAARTTAAAAGTARTPTSAAAPAISIAAMPIVTARVRIAPRFRSRHHIHHVVEIALLLRVGRRLVT